MSGWKLFFILCAAIILWPLVLAGGVGGLVGVATIGNALDGASPATLGVIIAVVVAIGVARERKLARMRKDAEIKRLQELEPEWRARELDRLQGRGPKPKTQLLPD